MILPSNLFDDTEPEEDVVEVVHVLLFFDFKIVDRATVRTTYGKINTFIYFNYRRKLKFDELETVFSVLFLLAFTQLQDASSIFSIPVES